MTAAAACVSHPTREAIGVCIECRARVCSECVTKVDGINHCVRCYASSAEREGRARDASRGPASPPVAWAALFGWLAVGTGLMWVALEIVMPGSG